MRRFHDYNPIAVAVYYLAVTGITMFTMNPIIIGISLFASVLNYALYAKGGIKPHLFSLILFLVLAVINPLINHNGMTVLFYLNDRPITMEAAVYGLVAAAMIVASLYWLRSFSKAMTSDKLLYLFGRLSPKISLILSMAIRYVELLRVRWRKIQETQKALGLYDDGNLIDALRGRARVLSILITWTLENGIVTAESMDARGYGTGRRTSFRLFRFKAPDILLITFCAVLAAIVIVGLNAVHINWYPTIEAAPAQPVTIAGTICFGVLTLLPVIINTKEAIRWRYLRYEN